MRIGLFAPICRSVTLSSSVHPKQQGQFSCAERSWTRRNLALVVTLRQFQCGDFPWMVQKLHPCTVTFVVLSCGVIPRLCEVFGICLAALEYDGLLIPSWTTVSHTLTIWPSFLCFVSTSVGRTARVCRVWFTELF